MSTSSAPELFDRAVAIRVAFDDDAMTLVLADGRELKVPLAWFPRLRAATRAELEACRLIGDGVGIHWEGLDEDLSVAGLLRGVRGPAGA